MLNDLEIIDNELGNPLKPYLKTRYFQVYLLLVKIHVNMDDYKKARKNYLKLIQSLPYALNTKNTRRVIKIFLHIYIGLFSPEKIAY
jgi:hypothetical protein